MDPPHAGQQRLFCLLLSVVNLIEEAGFQIYTQRSMFPSWLILMPCFSQDIIWDIKFVPNTVTTIGRVEPTTVTKYFLNTRRAWFSRAAKAWSEVISIQEVLKNMLHFKHVLTSQCFTHFPESGTATVNTWYILWTVSGNLVILFLPHIFQTKDQVLNL